MNKERKILKPGDTEYQAALDSFTQEDLDIVRKGLEAGDKTVDIAWTKKSLREGYMEYTTIELSETKTKIVFHFVKISHNLMSEISDFMRTKICGGVITAADIQGDVRVEAGENPLFRSNWDFIVFNYNKFKAPGIMNLIAKKLLEEFSA